MPQWPTVTVSKNVATVDFPKGWASNASVAITFNSSFDQHIELKIDGTTKTMKGTGERQSLEKIPLPENISKLVATFNYGSDKKPSALQQGGPFDIGRHQYLMVLAENGDDDDFNDTLLQIRGVVEE